MAKKKRTVRQVSESRANDIITYKILAAFVIATLADFLLMMVSSRYQIGSKFLEVNHALMIAGIAAALVALLGFVLLIVNRFVEKRAIKIIGAIMLPVGAAVWLSCMAMYYFFTSAITMLCFFFPAAAVIYLVYLIYQPEFFAIAVDAAVSAFGFYILSKLLGHGLSYIGILVIVGMALVNIALLAFALMAKKSDGKLSFGKNVINFGYFDLSFVLEAVTGTLFLVGLAVSLIVGAMAAYIFLFITLAYLFILAVYYTVKLM